MEELNMNNRIKSSILPVVVSLCAAVFLLSFASVHRQEQWEVPDSYKNMKNPVAADSVSITNGQNLYKKHCASCHGKSGLGDGAKARQLLENPGDMSSKAYQKQTDGEQFFKTKSGRDEMPSYEKLLSDKEIWDIVNYMRTFGK